MLREELQLLQEPGSYVGEVVKARSYTSPAPPPHMHPDTVALKV